MTREESKKELSKLIFELGFEDNVDDKVCALNIAIKALSQEPTITSTDEPMTMVYPTIVCDDAISRDALITKLMELIKTSRSTIEIKAKLIPMIQNMPSVTQKSGKWIPVSERLPEKYTYTLWCASSGYVRSDYFNGEFWEDAKKLGYEVIAWMPLPKPYEPQESEDKE